MLDTKTDAKEINIEDSGYYVLMEDISESACKEPVKWILKHNLKKPSLNELTLVICSYGGELHSALALIDSIKNSAIPIQTVGLGVVSSAGLLIFMSGAKGKRVLTPNTLLLSHQYTSGMWGKEHDLFAAQRRMDLTTETIIRHYKKCTKRKISENTYCHHPTNGLVQNRHLIWDCAMPSRRRTNGFERIPKEEMLLRAKSRLSQDRNHIWKNLRGALLH